MALLIGLVVVTPLAAACDRGATDVHTRNIASSVPTPVTFATTTTTPPTTAPPTTVAAAAKPRTQARTRPTTAHQPLSYNYEVQLPVSTKVYVVPATTTTTVMRRR